MSRQPKSKSSMAIHRNVASGVETILRQLEIAFEKSGDDYLLHVPKAGDLKLCIHTEFTQVKNDFWLLMRWEDIEAALKAYEGCTTWLIRMNSHSGKFNLYFESLEELHWLECALSICTYDSPRKAA